MKFYVLKRKKGYEADYDEHSGFVVAATSPKHARKICHDYIANEHSWHEAEAMMFEDAKFTSCKELTDKTRAGIVLQNFHAG